MKKLYQAGAISNAGREGHTRTDDGIIDLKLSRPNDGIGTNPEQLFACAYSACFGSAVNAVAKKSNIFLRDNKVHADITLNQDGEGGYFLSATIDALLTDIEQSVAESLTREAHRICPYSLAIRNNVAVKLKANGQEIKVHANSL